MIDQAKLLADGIESGQLAIIWCHPTGKFPALDASDEQLNLIVAALRAYPNSTGAK